MDFATVRRHIEGVPYILPEMARDVYDFILRETPQNCLELGFAHGASSCYIAAALEETGAGRLTCVDLLPAREWQQPAIEELLARTGLGHLVQVEREATSYTWFLKKQIEAQTKNLHCEPLYDFCFIDGAKNWTIDSSAFFLVDKLLKPGGWIVFDDLQWTYASKVAKGKRKSDGIYLLDMGEDELNQPHIELIFQLLVMQHPEYSHFLVKDNWWAWARKVPGDKNVVFEMSAGYRQRLAAWEAEHQRRHRPPFAPFDD